MCEIGERKLGSGIKPKLQDKLVGFIYAVLW